MRRRDWVGDWPGVQRWQGVPRPSEPDGNEFDRPDRTKIALVLGIVSLLIGPLGLIAWLVGADCLKAIEQGRMDPTGESNARVGRLLGIIALCMFTVKVSVLTVLFTVFFDLPQL